MQCPTCKAGKLDVTDTRVSDDGSVKRKRVCLACGEKFLTQETFIEAKLPEPKPRGARAVKKPKPLPSPKPVKSSPVKKPKELFDDDVEETSYWVDETIRESGLDIYKDSYD